MADDVPTPPEPPSIRIRTNGPYLVKGGVPLVRRRHVETEAGEPVAWETTAELDPDPTYALCRCGRSGDKPFCDGTHREPGPAGRDHEGRAFDGAETASQEPYDARAKAYEGPGLVMRDDRSICEHAGFCGTAATNAWKMVKDTGDTATRSQLIAMVERCPSGALTWRREADGADVEPALATQVAVVDDGPLFVTGGIPLERSDGTHDEVRNRMTLCRCGASSNKPYCDGSHAEAGFIEHG